jgi:hypothetical protein
MRKINMSPREIVLCMLGESGGSIKGKTKLQKRGYFLSLRIDHDLGYKPHYYGPFSPTIDSAISELKALGFVEERIDRFGAAGDQGFEIKRFEYVLTEDGKSVIEVLKQSKSKDYSLVSTALAKVAGNHEPDYVVQSVAAKAIFILKQQKKPMNSQQIREEAKKFDWNVSAENLNKAVEYLRKIELVSLSGK